jgi:2-aminoethylphosphonate-pyruvate transaminase
MTTRRILLNPGPATTTDSVKHALIVPDICPREREFGDVVAQIRRDLLKVAGADEATHTAVLLSGPGTAVMEASLGSLVPPDGRVLIVENGAYGERAAQICSAIGIPASTWRMPWTEQPTAAELDRRLGAERFTHVFWVHHETTTGMLNPLTSFGEVCRARGVTSIVDMMSSFAGLEMTLRDEPVDFVLSSANKCLQGMAGISFVIGPRAAIQASAEWARGYSLSLPRAEKGLASGQFPFTPPVQVVYALAQALAETFEETVAARAARYQECHALMLSGLVGLGFEPLLPEPIRSGLLTAFKIPDWPGFTFERLHDYLYDRGITLYPGKIPGTDTFRVATIGALLPSDLAQFIAHVKEFLVILSDARSVHAE